MKSTLRVIICALLAVVPCLATAQTPDDGALQYPKAGTYVLERYYLESSGCQLPTSYHQYKIHRGSDAGILWLFDKQRPSKDSLRFTFRLEKYEGRDIRTGNLQLLACNSDSYTQRWRKNSSDEWKVEVWRRTRLDGNALRLVKALVDCDCGNRLYGVYLNDKDDRITILTPQAAIVGRGWYSADIYMQCQYLNGWLFAASYPSQHQFKIGSRLYDADAKLFGSNRAYFLTGKLDIGGTGYDKYFMSRTNGFDCFEHYADKAMMIEADYDNGVHNYHRFVGENDTVFCRGVIVGPFTVSKKTSRLVMLRADKGDGRVISDWGDLPVRVRKDTTSAVLMMLKDDYGRNNGYANAMKCLGVEGDWYKVKWEEYGKEPVVGYVERDKALWLPMYYHIFD